MLAPVFRSAQPLLLCLSHLRWNFVYQRPQQLLSRAAQTYNVLFWEEPEFTDDVTVSPYIRFTPISDRIVVATPILCAPMGELERDSAQRALLDAALDTLNQPVAIAWFYTPMAVAFASHLSAKCIVYDCMDELTQFEGASPRLLLLERRLLRFAHLVFTGGRSLQMAKQTLHSHTHCFPSAVDKSHFNQAREPLRQDPPDQLPIPRPRIGFFGVIDERLDCELVAAVAALRPSWQIIMIGPTAKIRAQDLPTAPNIHWLGPKSYADLPAYAGGWDAGFMPFANNNATRFISPTKTPEFLAAGVPLVSTPIADVVSDWGGDGAVEIADGPAATVAALTRAMQNPRELWLTTVDRALAGISWDTTWATMHVLIEETTGRREPRAKTPARPSSFDWLIVGAGFAGAVLAERIARVRNESVLIIDRRPHVGGNAYDCLDDSGILIHKYGPHIFHTNSTIVSDYLSRYTEWRPYEHRVLAEVDGQKVPIPINLDTINTLYGLDLSPEELGDWFERRSEHIEHVRTSEDVVVAKVGRELYEKFFRGYTLKQWGLDPSQLDKAVTARVPVRTNRDDRYFDDTFQAMPVDGYTAMFRRMLDHRNITVSLSTEYGHARRKATFRHLVWTGPVDEFFGHRYGRLPYRSLQFVHETHDVARFQPVAVVNYPQSQDFTRITEYKHLTGQIHPRTSISYEFPSAEGDPYYPVPRAVNAETYRRYKLLADASPNIWFVGRLATYQYMNMDQVVGQALATFRRIQRELLPVRGGGEVVGIGRQPRFDAP